MNSWEKFWARPLAPEKALHKASAMVMIQSIAVPKRLPSAVRKM